MKVISLLLVAFVMGSHPSSAQFIQHEGIQVSPGVVAQPIALNASAEFLKRLFAESETDAAAYAATELTRLSNGFLSPDPMVKQAYYNEVAFPQCVLAYGFEKEVLEVLSKRPHEGNEYGAVCEMLEKKEEALGAYLQGLQKNPDDHGARARLVMLLSENNMTEAKKEMTELPQDVLHRLAQQFSQSLMNEQKCLKRLSYFALLGRYFELLEPDAYVTETWLQSAFQYIAQSHYENDVRIMELYNQNSGRYSFNDTEMEERSAMAVERRLSYHREMCNALLKLPQFASEGFMRLAAVDKGSETVATDYAALALKVLAMPKVLPPEGSAPALVNNYQYRPQSFLMPAEFLLDEAVTSGTFDALKAKVLPELERAGADEAVRFLQDMVNLYVCPESEFLAKAAEVLAENYPNTNPENTTRQVFALLDTRGLSIDRGPLILACLKRFTKSPYQSPQYIFEYAQGLRKAKQVIVQNLGGFSNLNVDPFGPGTQEVNVAPKGGGGDSKKRYVAFLDAAAETMIGPKAEQAGLIEKHYAPNRGTGVPGPATGIQNYLALLSHMMSDYELAGQAIVKAYDLKLAVPGAYNFFNQVENRLYYYQMRNKARSAYNVLRDTPMLGPLKTFRTYPVQNMSKQTLLGHLVYNIGRVSSSDRPQVIAPIKAHKANTFGKGLILAAIEGSTTSTKQAAVAMHLEKHIDAIKKLPDTRQQELAKFLRDVYSNSSGMQSSAAQQAPKAAAWLKAELAKPTANGSSRSRNRQPVPVTPEAFLKYGTRMDAQNHGSQLDQLAAQVMQALFVEDPAKAEEVYRHYLKVASTRPKGVEGNPEYWSAKPGLVLYYFLNAQPNPTGLAFAMKLVPLTETWEAGQTGLLESGIQQAIGALDFSEPAALVKLLAPTYRSTTFRYLCQQVLSSGIGFQTIVTWSEDAEKSPIVEDLRHCALLGLDAIAGTANEGRKKAVVSYFAKRLVDPEISPTDRAQVAATLMWHSGKAGYAELTQGCIAALATAWSEPDAVIPTQLLRQVMTAMAVTKDDGQALQTLLAHWPKQMSKTPPDAAQVRQVLAMAKASGTDVAAFLTALPPATLRLPGMVALLVEHDHLDQARKAVPWSLLNMPAVVHPRNRNQRVTRTVNGERVTTYENQSSSAPAGDFGPHGFTKDLHAKIEKFLPTIADPGQRFLTEYFVAAMPDAGKVEPARDARIAALAAKLDTKAFASRFLAEHAVSWLCVLPGVNESLRPQLSKYGRPIRFQRINQWQDTSLRRSREGLLHKLVEDSSANQPEVFAEILGDMLETHKGDQQQTRAVLDTYCRNFPASVLGDIASMTPKKAKAYLPLLRDLCGMSYNIYWSSRDQCTNGNFVLHVLANDTSGYKEWLNGLDRNTKANVESNTNLQEVVMMLRDGLKSDKVTKERRIEILDNIFAGASSSNNNSGSSSSAKRGLFQQMVQLDMVTAADILGNGPKWAESNPRSGAAYAELAAYQTEAGQEDEAVVSLLQAVMNVPQENTRLYTQYHMDKASLLLKLGRIDAAMTWFEFAQPGRIYSSMRSKHEMLRRQVRARYLGGDRGISLADAAVAKLASDPQDVDAWTSLAEVLSATGFLHAERSQYQSAAAYLKTSFAILHRIEKVDPLAAEELMEETKNAMIEVLAEVGEDGEGVTIIDRGSRWSYHYTAEGAPISSWRKTADFSHSSFRSGSGPFGYGDGDENTVLDFGKDEDNKPITAYFRRVFEVADPTAFDRLTLGLIHDDGALVYLNGKELVRNNLPKTGRISYETVASESRGSSKENVYWQHTFSAKHLVEGDNFFAVEVHQHQADSSDLGFDLDLRSDPLNVTAILKEVADGTARSKYYAEWRRCLPKNLMVMLEGLKK